MLTLNIAEHQLILDDQGYQLGIEIVDIITGDRHPLKVRLSFESPVQALFFDTSHPIVASLLEQDPSAIDQFNTLIRRALVAHNKTITELYEEHQNARAISPD